jgi:hypothetical protein
MSWNVQSVEYSPINSICVFSEREKRKWENENVSEIRCNGPLTLIDTVVSGKVHVEGRITATNSVASKIDSSDSATLTSTTCLGNVDVGGSLTAIESAAQSLHAGGYITANRCEVPGTVEAGGHVDLDDCSHIQSVSAGNYVSLRKTKVQGNVSAGSYADIRNSEIGGKLTCSSNYLIIQESKIFGTIDLGCISSGLGGISISNRNMNISFGNNISIGEGSSVKFGGITIAGVVTDGVPQSQLLSMQPPSKESQEKAPQILELRNCTVKNIIFRGGNGEVVLIGDSVILGIIIGGKIRS